MPLARGFVTERIYIKNSTGCYEWTNFLVPQGGGREGKGQPHWKWTVCERERGEEKQSLGTRVMKHIVSGGETSKRGEEEEEQVSIERGRNASLRGINDIKVVANSNETYSLSSLPRPNLASVLRTLNNVSWAGAPQMHFHQYFNLSACPISINGSKMRPSLNIHRVQKKRTIVSRQWPPLIAFSWDERHLVVCILISRTGPS